MPEEHRVGGSIPSGGIKWHFRIEVSTLGFQPKKEGAVPSSATNKLIRDRSSNWLERQLVTLEVVGSNPIGPAKLWRGE